MTVKSNNVNHESSHRYPGISRTESLGGLSEPVNRRAFSTPPQLPELPIDPGNQEAEFQESPFWTPGMLRPLAEGREDLPRQALEPLDPVEMDWERMYQEVDIQPLYWNPSSEVPSRIEV